MHNVTAKVSGPHAGCIAINIIRTENFADPCYGVHIRGTPDGSLFYIGSVDKLPSVNRITVDFNLQLADSGKTKLGSLREDSPNKVNGVLECKVILGECCAIERHERTGNISRNGNGRIGRKSLIIVQAEPEVRSAFVFYVPQRDSAAVGRASVFVDYSSRHCRIIHTFCIGGCSHK